MRHWRGALDQIYEHNANKVPPTYVAKTDTEKALIQALKQLELQCKERIDLLEALRVSREDSPHQTPTLSNKLSKTPDYFDQNSRSKGSIGSGTIPAVTYSELSRPSLPQRPSLPTRTSAEASSTGPGNRSGRPSIGIPAVSAPSRSPARPSNGDENERRSRSPEKYTMRTTLRSGKGDRPSKSSRKSSKPAGEGPSKAATLAWSALGREKAGRSANGLERRPVPQALGQRHSSEQARRPSPASLQWDSHSRRLVPPNETDVKTNGDATQLLRHSDEHLRPSQLSVSAASSALTSSQDPPQPSLPFVENANSSRMERTPVPRPSPSPAAAQTRQTPGDSRPGQDSSGNIAVDGSGKKPPPVKPFKRKELAVGGVQIAQPTRTAPTERARSSRPRESPKSKVVIPSSSEEDFRKISSKPRRSPRKVEEFTASSSDVSDEGTGDTSRSAEDVAWKKKKEALLKNLPPGVEESAAKQILNDIVVKGDEVRWTDIAGLDIAKNALREAVVYPFLRPDLFMGLREPARGMLLFGPPGTGKTMLARAVATESRSTFFSISASSLTSKFLGESEKLVRALFGLAKVLAPSIIFVDEIDSLLSQRSGSGEHEATRRIKTEFLIQWSDLQRAAAGRETTERDRERGDANRVLVLAATNLPWAIDEAARRRFVRRQYIPLPELETRETQLRTLLGQQKHSMTDEDIHKLVELTDGELCISPFLMFESMCGLLILFFTRFLGFRYHSPGQRRRHGPASFSRRCFAAYDHGGYPSHRTAGLPDKFGGNSAQRE